MLVNKMNETICIRFGHTLCTIYRTQILTNRVIVEVKRKGKFGHLFHTIHAVTQDQVHRSGRFDWWRLIIAWKVLGITLAIFTCACAQVCALDNVIESPITAFLILGDLIRELGWRFLEERTIESSFKRATETFWNGGCYFRSTRPPCRYINKRCYTQCGENFLAFANFLTLNGGWGGRAPRVKSKKQIELRQSPQLTHQFITSSPQRHIRLATANECQDLHGHILFKGTTFQVNISDHFQQLVAVGWLDFFLDK